MFLRKAAWRSIQSFLWNSVIYAATRCAWMAATPPPTRTATHESCSTLGLAGAGRARRLPRPKPGNGMAVRRRARHAGENRAGGCALSGSNRAGPRGRDWNGRAYRRADADRSAAQLFEARGGRNAGRSWHLPDRARPPFRLGRNAGRVSRSHHLVVSDGIRPWRRANGSPGRAWIIGYGPCAHAWRWPDDRRLGDPGPHRRLSGDDRRYRIVGLRKARTGAVAQGLDQPGPGVGGGSDRDG